MTSSNAESIAKIEEIKASNFPKLPVEIQKAFSDVQEEMLIFDKRVRKLQESFVKGAPKSSRQNAFKLAKYAGMCVRESLRTFGRLPASSIEDGNIEVGK